ncbi:MAG: hypothetical protein JWP74_553 [Marmoricola sp.]|nr:hypothetical protein [Marmoricola sp.]
MRHSSVLGVVAFLAVGLLVPAAHAQDFSPVPHLVRDLRPGATGSNIVTGTRGGASLGSVVVFGANATGTNDGMPWASDGTAKGTKLLSTVANDPQDFVAFKGAVYFSADDADGRELWKTDGTPAGTKLFANINAGAGVGSGPADLTVVGSNLYFVATPSGSAQQLFSLSAPPAVGPAFLHQVTSFTGTTQINALAAWGSKIVFASSATAGTGLEPWISDGTSNGTKILMNIAPGAASSSPNEFTPVGSYVYFRADTAASGEELWRSDGTGNAGATTQVADLWPGSSGSNPTDLYAFGNELLFSATIANGDMLWSTTGANPQVLVPGLRGGGTDDNPTGWTLYRGYVYFSGSTPQLGAELYRTMGSPATTTMVKNINTGTSNSSPQGFRIVAGELLFNAEDATHGSELWRSNGTSTGTALVGDLNPGSASSYPTMIGVVGNTLFFEALDVAHGRELWSYTAAASTTKASPKASYTKANAKAKHIHVTVKVTASGFTPTGTVVLKKGSTTIGTGTLANGKVSIRITIKLPHGRTRVRAYYGGSSRASTSSSAVFTVKVT